MDSQFLTGKLVRLTAPDSEKDAAIAAKWRSDTEYQRLLEIEPVRPATAANVKEQLEEMPNARRYGFAIRPLDDERVIGYIFCLCSVSILMIVLWGSGLGSANCGARGTGRTRCESFCAMRLWN